jgi:hypothetical protein
MNAATIRTAILRTLDQATPYAVPFETLHAEVNRLVRPALSAENLLAHLRVLLDAVFVDFIADPLEPKNEALRKWLIIEAGRAHLKQ